MEMDGGDGSTTLLIYLMSLTVHLKTRWQILSQFKKLKQKQNY